MAGISEPLRFYLGGGVLRRSLVVAAIVGTVLNLIAQGDILLADAPLVGWKIVLTYMVPFCVAAYGAVAARRQWRRSARALEAERREADTAEESTA